MSTLSAHAARHGYLRRRLVPAGPRQIDLPLPGFCFDVGASPRRAGPALKLRRPKLDQARRPIRADAHRSVAAAVAQQGHFAKILAAPQLVDYNLLIFAV